MPCQGPYGSSYDSGDSYRAEWLQSERRLCEARWLLLRLLEDPASASRYADLLAVHRQEQLEHRRGDKEQVLSHIRQTLDRIKRDMKEIERYGGTPGEALKQQVATLKTEETRIGAITDQELLANYWGSESRLTSDVVDH